MRVPSVLMRIAESVNTRLRERMDRVPESKLRAELANLPAPQSFAKAFTGAGIQILAEIKYASPSEGRIRDPREIAPLGVAQSYLRGGAVALSVLTEQDHFGGSLSRLVEIRKALPDARLLLKDFVIEEYQLLEARLAGADAALLIVALLGESRTRELLTAAQAMGLEALVEVHDEAELESAGRMGARLIGVNNRNLKDMKVSLEVSRRLAPLAPKGSILISESGLRSGSELRELTELGYRGFLIGTSFMRASDPGSALAQLLLEAQ